MIRISNKKSLFSLSVLFLIIGFCSLRKITPLMYAAQLLFLLCCANRISTKGMKICFNSYVKMSALFAVFAMLSLIWSSSVQDGVKALKPLLQLTVISILLNDYLDNGYKIEDVWKAFRVSSVILVVFLFLMTPASVWKAAMQVSTNASSAADRIGPSIGFQANWMGLICAFSIILWIEYLTEEKANKKISMIMIFILAVIVIFTKSRKAFIVLVCGPMIYWLLYKPRKKSILIIVPMLLLVVFGAIWAVFNIPFLYKMVGFRLIGLFGIFDSSIVADASVTTRADMVQIGLELFRKHPIIGVGFGNFSYHYFYNYSGWAETYAHNNYVEILADTGIIGFVLHYAVLFSMIIDLMRNWNKYVSYDRKITAFLVTFIGIRLIMDYGMVDYDDEFIQILTVNCYCALQWMKKNCIERSRECSQICKKGSYYG